jgi:aspartokinase
LISESGKATAVSSMKDAALIRAQDMANSDLISHITYEGAYTDDILLTTRTGQDEVYIVTRDGKADRVAEIIRKLAAHTQVCMTKELSLVALTGCRSEPTKVREVLKRANIETRSVSLSPSERSICSVLNREHTERAVRALHDYLMTQS